MSRRLLLWIATTALIVACGDDGAESGDDAGFDVADAGGEVTVLDDCDGVEPALSVGATCDAVTPCPQGAQCSRLDADAETGVCRQLCVPGVCETLCNADEVCLPLAASPGTGVCAVPPTGDQGLFEACGPADGACEAGATCLIGSPEAGTGACLPPCDTRDDCPVWRTRPGECVVRVDTASGADHYCSPACTPGGDDASCPPGMTCTDAGGGFVCAFP